MPVYKIQEEMPYEEFLKWHLYFEKRPIDWRDDYRTYAFLCTQGEKRKPWNVFGTLAHLNPATEDPSKGLKHSVLIKMMEGAKDGDKVDIGGIQNAIFKGSS